MTTTGKNLKLLIGHEHRHAVHALFTEVLGCTTEAPMPDLQLYLLADGFNVGVFYVDDGEHLDGDQWLRAPWLEFTVDDPKATASELARAGIETVSYDDTSHTYHRVPGGPVFRLGRAVAD